MVVFILIMISHAAVIIVLSTMIGFWLTLHYYVTFLVLLVIICPVLVLCTKKSIKMSRG